MGGVCHQILHSLTKNFPTKIFFEHFSDSSCPPPPGHDAPLCSSYFLKDTTECGMSCPTCVVFVVDVVVVVVHGDAVLPTDVDITDALMDEVEGQQQDQ